MDNDSDMEETILALWRNRLHPDTPEAGPGRDRPSNGQVGGDHYKDMLIQPSEFIYKNKLDWLQGNAIKYICRHNLKGGEEDIDKAIHYLNLLKEWYDDSDKT